MAVMTRWLLLGVSILLLTGCAAAVVGGAAAGGYYVARDDRSAEQIRADGNITSAINSRYVQDDLISALDINVDTRRGVVTLRGSVASSAVAARAVSLARGVDGVTQVISRITIAN